MGERITRNLNHCSHRTALSQRKPQQRTPNHRPRPTKPCLANAIPRLRIHRLSKQPIPEHRALNPPPRILFRQLVPLQVGIHELLRIAKRPRAPRVYAAKATEWAGGIEAAFVGGREAEVHGARPEGVFVGRGAEVPVWDEEGGDVVCIVVEDVLAGSVGEVGKHGA